MNKQYKTDAETRRRARERMRQKRRAADVRERQTFAERFWGRAEPIPETGCLLWTGHIGHSGHGQVSADGELKRTHRVAWEQTYGPIPEGMCVLHKCDIPACINPKHLFLGRQPDNMDDMNHKGRAAVGEKHGNSRLTADQVISIRKDGRGPSEVAKSHGISPSTVCDIRARRSWAHIEDMAAAMPGAEE